jgi:putative membrane protein
MSNNPTAEPLVLKTADRLAYDRTRLAYQNTMMGWIRTATTLISFGFTIYKILQESGKPDRRFGPREFGMTLVAIGLLGLLAGMWDYQSNMRRLRAECPNLPLSATGFVAAFVGILGILALIAMIFRE